MKIGFCGTMSVGKSTLVQELHKLPQFKDFHLATERSKYISSLGVPLNTDSTLKGQNIFLAERSAELMHDKLITDRTIIDIMAFTSLAVSIDVEDMDAFNDYAKRFIEEYDYIFYISPLGVEIEDNGVRTTDSIYRNKIDGTIKHIIADNLDKIMNFAIISGPTEDRIKQVLSYTNL